MPYVDVKGTEEVRPYFEAYNSNRKTITKMMARDKEALSWTRNGLESGDKAVERCFELLDTYPSDMRKNLGYLFTIGYNENDFSITRSGDIEAVIDHVDRACVNQFAQRIPYAVYIRADGKNLRFRAHIFALNVNVDTGRSITGYTTRFKWCDSIDKATESIDNRNREQRWYQQNADWLLKAEEPRRRPLVGHEWQDYIMDTLDHLFDQGPWTSDALHDALEAHNIHIDTVTKWNRLFLNYIYSPGPNSAWYRDGRPYIAKSQNLGTRYSIDGISNVLKASVS